MNTAKSLIVAALFSFTWSTGNACDICGCSAGGSSMGLLPLMQRHFFGIRWQDQPFRTKAHLGELSSREVFHTIDLWGRWQPTRRLQLIGDIPYRFTDRSFEDGSSYRTNGLGDVSLSFQYALLDPARQSGRSWKHTIQAGAGVKLPTGKTGSDTEPDVPALYPGSGSTDWLVTGLYALRHGDWGFSADASARLCGKSSDEYQFGNRLSASLRAFWNRELGNTLLMPYSGFVLDARDADREDGVWQSQSGGWATFGMIGAECIWKNWSAGFDWQVPVNSRFSSGVVIAQPRFHASITILIGSRVR